MHAPRITVMVAALMGSATSSCVSEGKRPQFGQGETDTLELDTSSETRVEVEVDAAPEEVTGTASGALCEKGDDCLTGHCLLGRDGRACAFDCAVTGACPSGLECASVGADRMCIDRYVFACRPCERDADCDGGVAAGDADGSENDCVAIDSVSGSGRFCGVRCGGDFGECAAGYDCVADQCRPSDGTCECSATAVALRSSTTCSVSAAEEAQCFGQRTCATAGAEVTTCDAKTPELERCDGLDNDCDGDTDEAVDCGDFGCKGEAGCATACVANDDCAPGLACDVGDRDGDLRTDECIATGEDGTRCTLAVECDSGFCNNLHCCDGASADSPCCARDSDCAALDSDADCTDASTSGCIGVKTFGRCIDSICRSISLPSAEGCVGQVCRGAQCSAGGMLDGVHLCDPAGDCLETADVSCDDDDVCTVDTCSSNGGCAHAPTSGETEAACYTFADATRGIGACHDGVATCQNGTRNGCKGEVGPSAEQCNGADDDCDGRTDEDTEVACFPFLCGGAGGCLSRCTTSDECAAGNFCDSGRCAGTGENGSICGDDTQCQSGHCGGGVCCEAGLCCRNSEDCAALDEVICEAASIDGCAGTRMMGVCNADGQCDVQRVVDPSACDGSECAPSACAGDDLVAPGVCAATVCVRAANAPCAPFACGAGACLDECADESDCADGAECIDKACGNLPNGASCTLATHCSSNHCNNGFCCASGVCCGDDDAACSGLDGTATCSDAGACAGSRPVGQCGAGHQCVAVQVPDPAACLGRSCGESECVNLVAGEFTLEGIQERQCDANATCTTLTRDCRAGPGGTCTSNSVAFIVSCNDCTPNRTACVVLDTPCYCE